MEGLSSAVRSHKAHAGIAHDGDADRTLMCDEKGRLVDGDMMLGIWALQMKKEGRLKGDTVVSTVMANLGLEHYLSHNCIKLIRTKVGDRFVAEKMLEGGYVLGGEQSGHIICFECNTTGDGPITALHMLHTMKTEGLSLSRLAAGISLYPQTLINVPVEKKSDIKSFPEITDIIREAEERLEGKGRVLVRPSGTEQKIRVMVEAGDAGLAREQANRIAEVIKQKMSD